MATRNTNGNYQIVLSTKLDTSTLRTQIKALNQNPPTIKIKVAVTKQALERVKELNDILNKTEALNNYTSALKNIQDTMKSYEKIASKTATAASNLANTVAATGTKSQTAAKQIKSLGDRAKDAFEKFSLWNIVSSMFYKIVNTGRQLIDTVIELDKSFTELQKVTDLTMEDFDKITNQAYELGFEVAKTTTEVINAMTEFSKSGYTVSESTGILAKNALMWTNIADGTVDASEASNMMISVMKAFNIEARNSTHIIDALNEVDILAFLYSDI